MNISQKSYSLRFRRWSRKAWAVFASLGQVVTIGSLRVPVSEQSLTKANSMTGMRLTERDDEQEDEEELQEIVLPGIECIATRPVTVPVGNPINKNCFIKKRLERMYSFQPLLF